MLIPAVALLYLAALIVLLLAPLRIVRYHTRFWELTGRYLGVGWTLGREHALDATINAGLFFPLGFLVHRRWRRGASASWATAAATLVTLALPASSVEFIQRFLPWRHGSVADVLANVLGAAIGVAVDTILAWSASRSPQDPG